MPPVSCVFCDLPVKPFRDGSAELVQGWVPHRAGGGANAVHTTQRLGRWAHWRCVTGSPVDKNQASLFEDFADSNAPRPTVP